MDTTNVQIKKQVFELLSALCVYSAEGYKRALEALEHYKTFRSERYRFKLIVDEVREAKSTEYQTVLLAFVNCLIISTPQLKVRNSNQIVVPFALKVSQFQNEFMKSSFLPKCEQKIVNISTLTTPLLEVDTLVILASSRP